jgi:hypothetical protein
LRLGVLSLLANEVIVLKIVLQVKQQIVALMSLPVGRVHPPSVIACGLLFIEVL